MSATLQPNLAVERVETITIVRFLDREIWEVLEEGGNVRATAEALRELVENDGTTNLLLDFGDVEILCSAMIGVLLGLRRHFQAVRGRLMLCGLRAPLVREVFRVTCLDRHFEIVDDSWGALDRVRDP